MDAPARSHSGVNGWSGKQVGHRGFGGNSPLSGDLLRGPVAGRHERGCRRSPTRSKRRFGRDAHRHRVGNAARGALRSVGSGPVGAGGAAGPQANCRRFPLRRAILYQEGKRATPRRGSDEPPGLRCARGGLPGAARASLRSGAGLPWKSNSVDRSGLRDRQWNCGACGIKDEVDHVRPGSNGVLRGNVAPCVLGSLECCQDA
jgi:hypothetical protein